MLERSLTVFVNYSNFLLCGSESDKAHIWKNEITEFLVFAIFSSVSIAQEGVFLSGTADPRIVAHGSRVLVTIPERLAS